MTHEAGTDTKSEFGVAEEIHRILRARKKPEQELIIRWVTESLGLSASPPLPPSPSGTTPPAPASKAADVSASANGDTPPRARDIRTFVAEKQPKSDVQFVAVAAYYYRFLAPAEDRKETITAKDLTAAAREAGRRVPAQPGVTLDGALRQGYVIRKDTGTYRLNAVGENLVAMTLPGTGGMRTGKKKSSKARGSKPSRSKGNARANR